MKLKEIAELIEGEIYGNPDIEIYSPVEIEKLSQNKISFYEGEEEKFLKRLSGCVITKFICKNPKITVIKVKNPRKAWAKLLSLWEKKEKPYSREHSFVSPKAKIGDGVIIYPFVFIDDEVVINSQTTIYPGTSILGKVKIGNRVKIGPGCTIGYQGFGYYEEEGSYYHIPHIGGVIIEDDVEIGAGTTIDRGTVGDTIIGKGTKIDNLVHIAHNVKIGKNCIIIAQTGIAGSCVIEDGVMIAGQVGIKEHVRIGKYAKILAKSAVYKDVPPKGIYSGIPARPHSKTLKAQAHLFRESAKC